MSKRYYGTCPHCGANLDPGERCDCRARAGKALVIGDGIVVKFEHGAKRASAERAAEYARRICVKETRGRSRSV